MRRHLIVPSITLALLLPLTSGAQRGPVSDTSSRVADRVFDAYHGTDLPGCALGVSRNGRVVYERGYGMANLETGTPITPASIFHVASLSKQFTAMSIMLLAKDGKLSVDDDIRKYLPEIPSYGTTITIRHLLTHTSGLRDQWELIALARGRFDEDRITEADIMDIVPRQTALNFTPGSEYVYSNTGFTLLGVIVKRVSGKSLRDFADERIFKPLGMTNTHFHDDYTMLVPGRTSAYAMRGGSWHVSIPNFDTYGATSLFTTVGDLLKWEANLDNPTVGDRALGRSHGSSNAAHGWGYLELRVRTLCRPLSGNPRRRPRRCRRWLPCECRAFSGRRLGRRRPVQLRERKSGVAQQTRRRRVRGKHARRGADALAGRRRAAGRRWCSER